MTALRTLAAGMVANSFKRLSLSSEETVMANLLPRTRANFDGGATWASDAAVGNNPTAGVGAVTAPTADIWSFSGAGIADDGKSAFIGGGHTDSGDGSVYTFDPEAAAVNINGGGSGISWTMALESTRYIDAFSNARPSSANSPAGNQETAPTTPTAALQAYWLWPNKNGVAMPGAGHTYHFNKFIPGTTKMLTSQWGSMDANQGCAQNAGYVFDISNSTMTGPLITMSAMPANGGVTVYGYVQNNNGQPTTFAINDKDGCAYTLCLQNFAYRLYKWTSPTTSSLALVDTGAFSGSTSPNLNQASAIIIPDPSDPTNRIYFQHSYSGGNDTNFMVVTNLNGGTPTMSFHTYASGTVTTDGLEYLDYDYDPTRGVIWMTDGRHLFKITPNSSLTAWTIAQVTGFTGDTPPDATVIGSVFPSLRYLSDDDVLSHVYNGGYRIFKPSDWSPPPTLVSLHTASFSYTGKSDTPAIAITLGKTPLVYTGKFFTSGQAVPMAHGSMSYRGRTLIPAQAILISKGSFGYTGRQLSVAQAVELIHASLGYNGRPFITGPTIAIHGGSFGYSGRILTPVQALQELKGHLSYTGRPFGVQGSPLEGHASLAYTGRPFVVSVGGDMVIAFGAAFLNYNGRSLDVPEQGGVDEVHDLVITPYTRATPPSSEPATVRYLNQQLQRIQRTLSDLTDAAEQVDAQEPTNLRRGMVRYAVAPWSAALSGEGLYIYKGPTLGWVKII